MWLLVVVVVVAFSSFKTILEERSTIPSPPALSFLFVFLFRWRLARTHFRLESVHSGSVS